MPGYHWLPDGLQRRLLEREGRRDLDRLARRLPRLAAELGVVPGGEPPGGGARGRDGAGPRFVDRAPPDELREAHGRYLTRPGADPEMAASLPFADVLGAWCRAVEPTSIADVGSGFSSWVVRRWAPEGAEIVSVDDDPRWLERTRSFVRAEGVRDGGFASWEAFRRSGRRHDLVVWDFSDVKTRARATPAAADHVAPGGALLFDDVHKHRLWKRARRLERRRDVRGLSLRSLTLDEHGRYAWVALFAGRGRG